MQKKKFTVVRNLLILSLFIIAASAGIIYYGKKNIDIYKERITALETELTSHKMIVYVASTDIPKGATIEEGINVYKQEIYTGLERSSYITADMLGHTAIVDIAYNEPVMSNMVTDILVTKDMRDYEISFAHLLYDLQEYDVVDIRMMFPDGSDYVLLSKKQVNNLDMDNNIFYTQCTEDEILRLSSALIDSFTTTGAYIYTTRYISENLQEEAIPNYPVRGESLSLMYNNPNIVEIAAETLKTTARTDLRLRLLELRQAELLGVAQGLGTKNNSQYSVLGEEILLP